ncbi:MAG: TonB-dependent receptor, partial [Alphaproteobacteria bacterium]
LHYELKDDSQSAATGICTHFTDGSLCPQTRAPEWTFSAGAQYRIDLNELGSLTPRLDVQYTSKIYFIPMVGDCTAPMGSVACPFDKAKLLSTAASGVDGGLDFQPGYALLNGRLTWESADGKLSVSGSVTNLTDEVYFYGKLALAVDSLGREQGNIAPPRQWLLTVRHTF